MSSRPGVQWTPDFDVGAAGLEVEAILNRFHLGFRTTAVASGALKLLARPEDVIVPRHAWAALAIEAADTAYMWRRTRTWQSLRAPWVTSVDSMVGLAAVALGSRAMHLQPQLDGTAWTDRVLTVRVAAVPLGDWRGLQLAAGVGIQLLPHLIGRPADTSRRIVTHLGPSLASAFAQSYVISGRMRGKARSIDARALRWASDELDHAVAAEERAFHHDVLAPALDALRRIASRLGTDPEAARRLATAEEARLREWMADDSHPRTPADRSDQMEVVEVGVRRLSRRIQGGIRLGSSLADVIEISRRHHRRPGIATAAALAIAARGAVGATLATESLPRVLGDARAQHLLSATDLLATLATGVHQHAERHDRSVAGWVERFLYEVSSTAGAVLSDSRDVVAVHSAVTAIRAGVALAEHRPLHQRIAAALNDAVVVHTNGRQVRRVLNASLDQARRLTAASLDLDDHWTELEAARLRHRAFVHDGVAQVLAAVSSGSDGSGSAGDLDPQDLRRWLDSERVRIGAVLGSAPVGPPEALDDALVTLADEFERRGLHLLTETSDLPAWTASMGATVVEIIREALNNVVKHAGSEWVWCGILQQDDGSVLVRITDFATDYPLFRPGAGTGTSTMIALARGIGADIEWFQTASGGTEVRVTMFTPSTVMSERSLR